MRARWVVALVVGAALCIAGALVLPVLLMLTLVAGGVDQLASGSVSTCGVGGSASTAGLTSEQVGNARTIIAVGKGLGVPPRGWVIAIATALQESGLRNLHYGDRDSLGLMQQRPSAGWGTPAQVTDPAYAARAFFGGPGSPTRDTGLLGIHGWQSMPLWEAAQSVQHSAFPMAYAAHEALASALVGQLAGTTAGCTPLQAGPWGYPVTVAFTLTSGFGPRISPTTGAADFHTGQDFAVPIGTTVVAASAGVVEFTGWDGGYGNLVKIRHAHGVETYYGHLSRITCHVGQPVQKGTPIALSGSTGNSTGPHVHFEVRVDGRPIDPMPFLQHEMSQPDPAQGGVQPVSATGGALVLLTNNVPFTLSGRAAADQIRWLLAQHPDVLLMQEVTGRDVAAIAASAPGNWAVYQRRGQGRGGSAIVWNADKLTLVSSGSRLGFHGSQYSRYLDWVVLRSQDGLLPVVVMHLPTRSGLSAEMLGDYQRMTTAYTDLLRQMSTDGASPIIGADWNHDLVEGNAPWSPGRALGRLGYEDNWQVGTPCAGTGHHNSKIDGFGFDPSSVAIIDQGCLPRHNSDHVPVWIAVTPQ